MDLHETVTAHYGNADMSGTILAALDAGGQRTSPVQSSALWGVDQLHAGFAPATSHVLDTLDIGPTSRLLDVGCGIGGPARMAAERGAHVVGVDLTAGFVETARSLTAMTDLSERITFLTGPADQIDLPDASFDAAMMIHVGMNIPDKRSVFVEVRRLLEPGGTLVVYDQMRAGPGRLTHPLPWAVDESSSFVATPDEYVTDLESAGFTLQSTQDRTAHVAGGPPPSAGATLSPAVILGPDFVTRIGNNLSDTAAGRLGAFLLVATAD